MRLFETLCSRDSMPIFALFSGGNHSHVSTHFAMNNGAHEVIHIDTGIGIKATKDHAIACCEKQGWPFRVITPPDKTFREFVLKYGFPGPAAHRYSHMAAEFLHRIVEQTSRDYERSQTESRYADGGKEAGRENSSKEAPN